jgi:hypothetical protein
MKLADFEYVIDFPRRSNVAYVLFYVRDGADNEKPFYVGKRQFTSRMSEYLRADFGAATDLQSRRGYSLSGPTRRTRYSWFPGMPKSSKRNRRRKTDARVPAERSYSAAERFRWI